MSHIHLRIANRVFAVIWFCWLVYWLGFYHWNWANDVARKSGFRQGTLPADFFSEPSFTFHQWVAVEKLDDAALAKAERSFANPDGSCRSPQKDALDRLLHSLPPKGKEFRWIPDNCSEPYGDLNDGELARQVRLQYVSSYRSYFDNVERHNKWGFLAFYWDTLEVAWTKSLPHGVEVLSGLLWPAVCYLLLVFVGRWAFMRSDDSSVK